MRGPTPPSRRPRQAAARLGVLLALVALLAACGLPADSSPRVVAQDALPEALQPAATTTSTTVPGAIGNSEAVAVWWVGDEGLLDRELHFLEGSSITNRRIIEELLAGPTEEEATRGLTTAIPATVEVLDAFQRGRTLTIDLSPEFFDATGANFRRQVAQIVFTAVDQERIDSVLFLADGEPRVVPTGEGVLTENPEPVDRSDYSEFDPDVAREES